jgi:hypothetical protein
MILYGSRLSGLIAAGLILGSSTAACAQQPPTVDKSLVRAALLVRAFDQLAAQCKSERGFNDREAASIATWESEQGVGVIRTQMRGISADMQKHVEKAATMLINELNQRSNDDPCALALALTTTSSAKFATANPPGSTNETKPGETTSTAPSVSSSAPLSALITTIDSFGFNTRMTMGVGGFLTQDIYPVVLFRNGEALKDVKGLTYSRGLSAHRSSNPEDWTRWRRGGGRVELQTSEGWKPLPFSQTYQSLPKQFRLEGTYRSLSGTGNVAIGGSSSVVAWRTYTFSADGRIVRDGGAGASSGGTVTSSTAPNQRGRYQIDGLILRIRYDDGTTEERMLITNPKDPKSAIWLDGYGYSRRK